jgi:hypothetical protein
MRKVRMIRPSEKSLAVAEELLDYVHPGMPRAAALQEVAQMVDGMNVELLAAVHALINEMEPASPSSHDVLLNHLKHVVAEYKPWTAETQEQHELFTPPTETVSSPTAVAGQMP